MRTIRLEGLFRLRAPLSHIGETISSTSYLVEDIVLQSDGRPEKVFAYSGNAWRGQLRDRMAAYMLDKLGRPRLTIDAFHLLFSGGRIGGAQSTDLAQARELRACVPLIALLGGGVGNQILAGKLRVGTCYPLCREAIPVLPASLHALAATASYADLTMLKEYSRRNDAKIDPLAGYLSPPPILEGKPDGKPEKGRKTRRDDGPSDQMRIRSELVVAGTVLRTWISGLDVSDIELGCLVSGMHAFASEPIIGGQGARGHGLVDLEYSLIDSEEPGVPVDFLKIEDRGIEMSPVAHAAKAAYDAHLRHLYDMMLADKGEGITRLLGAA